MRTVFSAEARVGIRRVVAGVIAGCLALAISACAATGSHGFIGYGYGEPDEAQLLEWTRLAIFDDAEAQFQLGLIYERGRDFPRNPVDAARLYGDAMNNGSVKGAYNLGLLYMRGAGVKKDPAQAAKLFETAAKGGSGRAMLSLGSMYDAGIGVKRDPAAAHRWYVMAAKALPAAERQEADRLARETAN